MIDENSVLARSLLDIDTHPQYMGFFLNACLKVNKNLLHKKPAEFYNKFSVLKLSY